MSREDLQEMEVGTKPSKTAVNANANGGDQAMPKLNPINVDGQTGSWEDLGGPTPENYRPDDDSSKVETPGGGLKQVKDVVNSKAVSGDQAIPQLTTGIPDGQPNPGPSMKYHPEEVETEGEEISEEEVEETMEVVAEEEVEAGEDFSIEEDVNALLEGEELSEEFQEKAKTIFETALRTRVYQMKEVLDEQYAAALQEEVQEITDVLSERVDAYLEYVAEEWFTENQLVVEDGLKADMTESFLGGMKSLFEEHYVSIPEEKYNVFESMVEKLDEMETKLNEQIEKNVALNSRLAESVADGILDQVSEGLADTQKDKLAALAESVEFESEEAYREKLATIRESYFPARKAAPKANTETLSEGVDSTPEVISGSMSAYLRTLQSFKK